MTTINAFMEMLGQFIDELVQTFPDEQDVKKFKEGISSRQPREVFDEYMKDMSPWTSQMMGKSDEFFCDQNNFVSKLNLHEIWKKEECTPNTRAAIWQYFQTLYMLGTTISMFPPETLSMIEAAAETAAKNIKNSNQPPSDAALMAGVNSMLSQMMSGGGLGAMFPPPQQPARKPKHKSKKISR
jgi:hypothetical protein